MAELITDQRAAYILVLIYALAKRAASGELDTDLADHIERLLGEGKPDPAGEAEYASWTHGVEALRHESESHQTPIPSPMDYEGEG